MSHQNGLEQWTGIVSRQMPQLSQSQARVLALYSFGVVVMRSSGMRTLSVFLGALLGRKENSVRQQLREFCYDAPDKRGQARQEVDITVCFGFLVAWVLSVDGQADRADSAAGFDALLLPPSPSPALPLPPRLLSCFTRGLALILAALLRADPCPFGRFVPDPWPAIPDNVPIL